jgi:hypothetical protein
MHSEKEAKMRKVLLLASLSLVCLSAQAGVIDPDCTAEKAAKSAAMKATVGVGGRCDAKEAAADSMGLDDKKDAVDDAKDNIGDAKDDAGRKALKKAIN